MVIRRFAATVHQPPRVVRPRFRAFTLLELIAMVVLVTFLIGLYLRALDEADLLGLDLEGGRVLSIEQKAILNRGMRQASSASAAAEPDSTSKATPTAASQEQPELLHP
jgi:hypothetical protein